MLEWVGANPKPACRQAGPNVQRGVRNVGHRDLVTVQTPDTLALKKTVIASDRRERGDPVGIATSLILRSSQ
jgi:hypothetical protein